MAAAGETYRLAFPPLPKPHLSTGVPFAVAAAHHVNNTYHASKVYVIVSNSISKTANFTMLQEALGDRIIGVRKGIKPHTPWDDVLEIIHDVRSKDADIIITLGAGSLTDGAKIVSFALANNVQTIDDLSALAQDSNPSNPSPCSLPIINIPTSLSGGEYSPFAGATDTRTHHKRGFGHATMGADLIILDAALSISTPERIWLSTGMRAVDHCVEGLCSLDARAAQNADALQKGLGLLVPGLLKTKGDWEDESPRMQCMMGVVQAARALKGGLPMGGSHGIGHQLGPLGVGHGETSCVMLPAVLKYNYKYGDEKVRAPQRKVLEILWGEETVAGVLRKRGLEKDKADAGDVLGAIVSDLGMPRTLRDVGVGREKLDALAENCLKDAWLPTNAVPLTTKEQVLEILDMVVGDGSSL